MVRIRVATIIIASSIILSCSKLSKTIAVSQDALYDMESLQYRYQTLDVSEEKVKAARYLLDNMAGHTVMVGDYVSYYAQLDSILSVHDDGWERKDSAIRSLTQAYENNIRYVPLETCVTTEYLIHNIDDAFEQWKNGQWAKHLDFEHFCEYLLPLTASEKQPLFDWRSEYFPIAYGSIGNLEECYDYKNDPHAAAAAVNDMLHSKASKQYRKIEPHAIPVFPAETFFKFPYAASCEENADLVTLIMRAKGIPTAIDFTPQWPDRRNGHSWCVIWSVHGRAESFNPLFSKPGVQFMTHQRVAKVFRRTYAPNREFLKDMARLKNTATTTGTPFFIDVTEEYTTTSDITVRLDRRPDEGIAFIAVFDNFNWHPIWYGHVHGKRASFKGMGRDVTYMVMAFEDGKLVPFSDPFRLDRLGSIEYIQPDYECVDSLHLDRRFPLRQHVYYNVGTLRNGIMEASNNKYEWDTLSILPKWPLTSGSFEIIENKPYRYWRFTARDRCMSDMAEVFYYDSISGSPVRNFRVIEPSCGYELLHDGDPLTYFRAEGSGYRGCVDFGKPVSLKRIEYILRGDGDAIFPGDTYEVSYWDKGKWQMLKTTVPDDVWLDVPDAPSDALFYIKDITRGEDNRIFQWDRKNGIIWR